MKNTSRIKIGKKWVGQGFPVFIIAEAGVNHNGKMTLAKKLIDLAKAAGADAVKFQSFKTEAIITPGASSAKYHLRATGGKESWFDLLKRLELDEGEQQELFDYCTAKGVIFLSTPYDEASAEFLNKLGVTAFKVASTDMNNLPFLSRLADYGKPILLSTGMADLKEVEESVRAITDRGNKQIVLLQCTSNYPPVPADTNLNVLDTLREKFGLSVGYSDHLALPQAAVAAVAKGACVYEAHYTLDCSLPGPDHKSSLEPTELEKVISDIRLAEKLLGSPEKTVTASEKETRLKLRKSLVASADIGKGERFSDKNLGVKRPGHGLPPKMLAVLIGKKAKRVIHRDALIRLRDVE